MKTLIAVVTCRARRKQADALRATWAQGLDDVVFFVGEGPNLAGEVALAADDSYKGLPAKVKAASRWALDRGYDAVLKVDDDVYLVPERLRRAGLERYDYAGNFRMHNGDGHPYDYCSGFCYWLGPRGLRAVAEAPLTEDTMEDRWVGQVVARLRPLPTVFDEKRFACLYPAGIDEAKFLWGSPVGKTVIAAAQYPAEKFQDMHYWYERAFTGAHSVSR